MTVAQDRQSMEPGSSPAREAINEMLEALGLAEVEHNPRNNRMRAI